VLLLLLQLLFLLFLLIVNGEPLRAVFFRRLRLFSDLDFLQICILDVYVGGLILYVLAMLPFGLFSWIVVVGFALLSMILSVIIHSKTLVRWASFSKLRAFWVQNKKTLLTYLVVFLMFMIFLLINLSSLSGLVFGSVRDESVHSLDVQVILENHSVPLTLKPYVPEGVIYPQASHVILAFATYMLNMDVPDIVLYVSVLFKSLSVLGAYFLGRKLGSGIAYSLGLSFVFAFISSWPLNITWGGNPFLVGFPLFLVCLGLLYSLSWFRTNPNLAELITVGLLFGYIGTIIISYLQALVVIAFLVFIYCLIKKRREAPRFLGEYTAIFGVSLLPLSPFLYRFFAFYQYPGHNIGLPYDFTGWTSQQSYLSQALQWAFQNLSPYALLTAMIILILTVLALLLWKTRDYLTAKSVVAFALAVFAAASLLSFISFFLPPGFDIISWGHQGIILSIPISILILTFYIKSAQAFRESKIKRLSKIFPKGSKAAFLLTIALLSLVTFPFLYYRFLADPESLRGAYDLFAVTTQSDYNLMTWMKANLSSNAVILVHPSGSGLFIPSISHDRIVFPYSGSSLSSSYQTLAVLLENNTLNASTYQIMRSWNVSYVFVGTNVIYEALKWNPELFLGNPNFKLTKNFKDSYLFKLEEYDPTVTFLEDFEYTPWDRNGWRNYSWGNGLGNATITNGTGANGSRSLTIKAQAVPTVREWELRYAYWVEREIFASNDSDVTLSFYLDATEGFGGNDTFALLISNIQSSQTIVIATPKGIFQSYPSAAILDGHRGLFSYNLSKMWRQVFNSSLPQTFVLQLANYDFDGIPSVAHVDNITVTATPTAYP
jgi:hypothetical protein